MGNGIQGNTSLVLGGGIAKFVSHPGMSRLMYGYGKKYHPKLDNYH